MPPESSKSFDTTQRPVYAGPGPRLVAGPTRDDAFSPAEEMSMTKAELVDQVAATVHLSKSQTDAVLTQCLQAIIEGSVTKRLLCIPVQSTYQCKTRGEER
jgi:hypothetical protein